MEEEDVEDENPADSEENNELVASRV